EIAFPGDELEQDGAEAHRTGEEHADHGIVGEVGLLADVGNEQPDEDAEGDHDGEDPVVELVLIVDAGDKSDEQAEGNASEGAVSKGIAKERHAIADDKRADRTAGEPDKQDREGTADLEVDVEEGVGREKIVEGPDRPIKPGAKHATPPETP